MSTEVSEACVASIIIALMMEAARTSATSVDIQLRTRQYIPEDSELHTRRRENLKSHKPTNLCNNFFFKYSLPTLI
jgi:hypothetical protein